MTTESARSDLAPEAPTPTLSPVARRRAARAGFLGSVVEYYDFLVYAFLAVTIGPLFFPAIDPTTSLLATLAVYGAGYIARPLGAVFFDWLGDRRGRRGALLATVFGMGVATCLIGLLPTYEQGGMIGPVLLVVTRCLQGFSAGGELMGASTYLAESGTPERRGRTISYASLGTGCGAALAPIVVGLLSLALPPEQMTAWGWRIPFLLSIPLFVLCLWLRRQLDESPEFRKAEEQSRTTRSPLRELLREHGRSVVLVMLVAIAASSPAFLTQTYMNVYLSTVVGLSRTTVYWVSAVGLVLTIPAYLMGGLLTDRFGPKATLITMLGASCVLSFPMLVIMRSTDSVVVITLAYLVLLIACTAAAPPTGALSVGSFPTEARYSGAGISNNIGTIIALGFGPFFAELLTGTTGNTLSPALLAAAGAMIGIPAALAMRARYWANPHAARIPRGAAD
jgi:MHS family proline/betaine transporter-like MFS transporter